jgi:hypothetical protein
MLGTHEYFFMLRKFDLPETKLFSLNIISIFLITFQFGSRFVQLGFNESLTMEEKEKGKERNSWPT